MAKNSITLYVLIASPSDTALERQVISEVIRDWSSANADTGQFTLQDYRWELDSVPEIGAPPQEILNRQLVDRADIMIAVFSSRLGSPTNVALSGTVEEIERAASAQKPVLIYFSNAPLPRDHDSQQLKQLQEYKDRLKSESLSAEFETIDEFRRILTRHLAATIARFETTASSPWDHYNGQKTLAHKGQQAYQQSIPENFISYLLPAPWSHRSLVEVIAQHSQRTIPIDRLTALPDQHFSIRGKALSGKSGKYIDEVLDNYPQLEWWFSDKGLNITEASSS